MSFLRRFSCLAVAALAASSAIACGSSDAASDEAADNITSRDGTILDFTFKGEVVAYEKANVEQAVITQLQYVQGILTVNEKANGQIGHVVLSEVTETPLGDDRKSIKYSARLPVAWPKDGHSVPKTYEIVVPKDLLTVDAFNRKYDGKCGKAAYGPDALWHDWNPKASGCSPAPEEIMRATAQVSPSVDATHDKYPEYDQVWKDNELDVVVLFALADGGHEYNENDSSVQQLNNFLTEATALVRGTATENKPASAGILRDTTILGKVKVKGEQRTAKIDILLVPDVANYAQELAPRYDPLSEKADVLMYNGHAGLGTNLGAFSTLGKVAPGKYQLLVLNGCQSFAYVDGTPNKRRIEANGASNDPKGTRFMDIVANAMPGNSIYMNQISLSVLGSLATDSPKTYDKMLKDMPAEQLVAVFGEEDNTFKP